MDYYSGKELFIIFTYIVIFPIIIFFLIRTIKSKDNRSKKTNAFITAIFILIAFETPWEKIIDSFSIKLDTIEKAFKFNYGNKYNIIFKEKVNDTYFVVGKPKDKNNIFLEYSCYRKTKNGWRIINRPHDNSKNEIVDGMYQIFYCNNENISGIFIESIPIKYKFKSNENITDKYGTKFKYIKDINNKAVLNSTTKSYIYFAPINHKISKSYYMKINKEKLVFKDYIK